MAAAFTVMKATVICYYVVGNAVAALYLSIICWVPVTRDTNLSAEISTSLPLWNSTEERIDTSTIILVHTQGMGNGGYGNQIS